MRITILSIFPEELATFARFGVIQKAQESGSLQLELVDPREYTTDVHRSVDDAPFGGGPGMLMKCAPLFEAVENNNVPRPVILLSPGGESMDQRVVRELAGLSGFTLLCGRYEGVDYRVEEHLVDRTISLGDFVLAGGELAALCVLEAVSRLLPEVLGNEESARSESFEEGLLEYPQYTRPSNFRGYKVPEILLSGNHREISRWRRRQSLLLTAKKRPDLLKQAALSDEEVQFLRENGYSEEVEKIGKPFEDENARY